LCHTDFFFALRAQLVFYQELENERIFFAADAGESYGVLCTDIIYFVTQHRKVSLAARGGLREASCKDMEKKLLSLHFGKLK